MLFAFLLLECLGLRLCQVTRKAQKVGTKKETEQHTVTVTFAAGALITLITWQQLSTEGTKTEIPLMAIFFRASSAKMKMRRQPEMLLPTEEERECVCARIAKEQVAIHQSQSQRKGGRGASNGHRASVWWPLGQLRHRKRGVKMKSSRKINEASWVNALPPPKGSTAAGAGADDDEGDEGVNWCNKKKSNGLFLSFSFSQAHSALNWHC